jgi:hypothetical protein
MCHEFRSVRQKPATLQILTSAAGDMNVAERTGQTGSDSGGKALRKNENHFDAEMIQVGFTILNRKGGRSVV